MHSWTCTRKLATCYGYMPAGSRHDMGTVNLICQVVHRWLGFGLANPVLNAEFKWQNDFPIQEIEMHLRVSEAFQVW